MTSFKLIMYRGEGKSDGCIRHFQCMENCLASNYTKLGYCPDKGMISPFEAACLVACDSDSRCPDFAKCCPHDCGITCMQPTGLDNRTGENENL